tara:strand:+ start:1219 stop:1740 length:522 start_codon:yes stop_codon:yes gene_type:complete
MIYSGFTLHYYNNIVKERMKKGPAFCVSDPNIGPEEIATHQMVAQVLLGLTIVVFILKVNHDFYKCNYNQSGSLAEKAIKNPEGWYILFIATIFAISIYELVSINKYDKCREDVTNNTGLLTVNSLVIAIISLMILFYFYDKYIENDKSASVLGNPPGFNTPSKPPGFKYRYN